MGKNLSCCSESGFCNQILSFYEYYKKYFKWRFGISFSRNGMWKRRKRKEIKKEDELLEKFKPKAFSEEIKIERLKQLCQEKNIEYPSIKDSIQEKDLMSEDGLNDINPKEFWSPPVSNFTDEFLGNIKQLLKKNGLKKFLNFKKCLMLRTT